MVVQSRFLRTYRRKSPTIRQLTVWLLSDLVPNQIKRRGWIRLRLLNWPESSNSIWLPEDDAYQTFLEDEFTFEIALAAKGQKRLILQEPSIFYKEFPRKIWHRWGECGIFFCFFGPNMRKYYLLVSVFCALLFGLLNVLGCQSWRGRGSGHEARVDATLASPIPSSAPQAIPEKPQKGFEQEAPKAQNP